MSQPFDFRAVLKPRVVLTMYNPNPIEVQKDYNGNTYVFPPRGTVDIYPTQGKKHNREGEFETFEISPATVAAHFVGDDGISGHLGPLGIRVLSGNPEIDEQIKADAEVVCQERHYINDLAKKNAHMAAVRVAKEAGNPAPSPDRATVDAFNRIAAYEAGGNRALPFQCPECAMPFLTAEEIPGHREAQHKGASVPAAAAAPSADVAALTQAVAALTQLVTAQASAQVSERKKPGPKPKSLGA